MLEVVSATTPHWRKIFWLQSQKPVQFKRMRQNTKTLHWCGTGMAQKSDATIETGVCTGHFVASWEIAEGPAELWHGPGFIYTALRSLQCLLKADGKLSVSWICYESSIKQSHLATFTSQLEPILSKVTKRAGLTRGCDAYSSLWKEHRVARIWQAAAHACWGDGRISHFHSPWVWTPTTWQIVLGTHSHYTSLLTQRATLVSTVHLARSGRVPHEVAVEYRLLQGWCCFFAVAVVVQWLISGIQPFWPLTPGINKTSASTNWMLFSFWFHSL